MNPPAFELRATDLGARIGILQTKSSKIETPALLPVIHPVRQLIPCKEIKAMGFEAVMTNAYTTYKRLSDRAYEGIHKIIGFDGTVMTDSGGYQVLEFGSVEVDPLDIARFEEKIGSDIAIILDKPTGLDVTRKYASRTVIETLDSARRTLDVISRSDTIWTLPIQGGKYLDLVAKSATSSSKLDFGCFALGSPVEVMEQYDFSLLVKMILASKTRLPPSRPFHLFGAGHPLIIPLAVALGCDMFDSASYILYARNDRYITSAGTVRLDQLQYLPCDCKICSATSAKELRSRKKEERTYAIAMHNLFVLRQTIQETKQAIWEGRLWEYVKSRCSSHPLAYKAFKTAVSSSASFLEVGTQSYKDRGLFVYDIEDAQRPEIARHEDRISNLDLSREKHLVIVPETRSKPFLVSDIFQEILKGVDVKDILICCISPVFGLVPAEISDVYPISQITHVDDYYPHGDLILNRKRWRRIDALLPKKSPSSEWLRKEIENYSNRRPKSGSKTEVVISRTYKSFKRRLSQV